MPLPSSLTFSQASLQDYADCPRRFQLRYLLDVRWPAAHDGSISEWEARAQLGSAFHRLIYQHTVGIPIEALARTIEAEDLRRWWHAYLDTPPAGISGAVRQSEVRLTAPLSGPESAEPGFAGHRLMARYDLLAIEPGRQAVIVFVFFHLR